MKSTRSLTRLVLTTAALAAAGCGGGGGSSSSSPSPAPTPAPPPVTSPAIQVLPTSFDFGRVTTNNNPAPLEVTIRNTGTAALNVSAISLAATTGGPFTLAMNAGSKPCGSATPSIAAADSCTVTVSFQPATSGPATATLQVNSNSQASPVVSVPISGSSEPVTALTLRISQLETSCPLASTTAYTSVVDQGGYPLTGLGQSNFAAAQQSATLANTPVTITSVSFANAAYRNVAISALLDYSRSLTDQTVAFGDMKTGFSNFLGQLKPGDVAEIIKFATENEVTQTFTSDVTALRTAINLPLDKGFGTRLYDTVYLAIEHLAGSQTTYPGYRRAVVVATDGVDELPPEAPSVYTLQQVIDNARAKNVPIFTIGIGTLINTSVLGQMASQTGGLFYRANASQNLATIYQQLASLLFVNQYVIKFDQLPRGTAGVTSNLTLTGTVTSLSASDTKPLTSCP